jgi:hypothetical protein
LAGGEDSGVAKHPTEPLKARDIQGVKYVERLLPTLDALHDVGCGRDKAGNRRLHYDQYCMLVLLSLFNPVVRSLRGLEQEGSKGTFLFLDVAQAIQAASIPCAIPSCLGWSIMIQSPSRKTKRSSGGAINDGSLSLFVEYSALSSLDTILVPLA